MTKRITLTLEKEAIDAFDKLFVSVNEGFEAGRITVSDLMTEIILSARIDIRALQLKHSDLRKSLRALSNREEIDLETAIKTLTEMRGRVGRRRGYAGIEEQEC